jgi:CBS domain-containing protein
MDNKRVRELMVPIDEYPTVSTEASLLEAIEALNRAQRAQQPGRQPFRAVLVKDASGRVVGKIGQLAFLRALQPKQNVMRDMEKMTNAGVSAEVIDSMMEHFRFFEDTFSDLCVRGLSLRVVDAMHPIAEAVNEDTTLPEAIHKIVLWQQLSLLVVRGEVAVGLLRLSDLCDEVARQMKQATA